MGFRPAGRPGKGNGKGNGKGPNVTGGARPPANTNPGHHGPGPIDVVPTKKPNKPLTPAQVKANAKAAQKKAEQEKKDRQAAKKARQDRRSARLTRQTTRRAQKAVNKELRADSLTEFRPEERALKESMVENTQHGAGLDSVLDSFKRELAGQKAAAQIGQQMIGQQQAQQQAQLGQTVAAGNADSIRAAVSPQGADPAQGGQGQYGAQLAQMAGASAGAAAQNTGIMAQVGALQGQTQQAGLDRLGVIEAGDFNQQKGKVFDRQRQLADKRTDLRARKGAYRTKDKARILQRETENAQTQFENEIAAKTLVSKDKDSQRDFKAKMAQIKASLGMNAADNLTASQIAKLASNTKITTTRLTNATQRANALTSAQASTRSAGISANARLKAAKIAADASRANAALRAANSGGGEKGGAGDDHWYVKVEGKTVKLTNAEHNKWTQKRQSLIGAHRALRRALASTGDVNKAIKQVAASSGLKQNIVHALLPAAGKKKVGAGDYAVLASFMPGGFVPPGYITGETN